MSTLIKRIAAGMGANALGQAISIGMQLASLPLFLMVWGTERYGVWLLISAIPAYFSMADVGMVNAAGNKMTMAIGAGSVGLANRIFQSALVFMLGTCTAIVLVAMIVLLWCPLPLPAPDSNELRLTLAALVLVVIAAFFNGLAEAIFRATGRYGLGTFLGNMIRIAEWSGGMIGLWLDGSFSSVALGMLIARLSGVAACVVVTALTTPGISWGIRQASLDEVKIMIKPALYFLVFPVSNALSLQGFTLLVGALYGASAVAVFNTYRTLSRVTVQATSILSHAIGPEMSRLYGAGKIIEVGTLFRRSQRINTILVLLISLSVGLLAPALLRLWTHGRIPYAAGLLWVMMAYATASGLWHVPRILLMSINQHIKMAWLSLAINALALPIAWLIGQKFPLEITAWTLVASELILTVAIYKLACGAIDHEQSQRFCTTSLSAP